MWYETLIEGDQSSYYKYALLLDRNNYVDFANISPLIKSRRSFSIWKWEQGIRNGKMKVSFSGWRKIVTRKNGSWHKEEQDNSLHMIGSPMMPAHMFFRTDKEFKRFIGKRELTEMFSDLL